MKLTNNLSFDSIMSTHDSNYRNTYLKAQLDELQEMYEKGFDIRNYVDPQFSSLQLRQIKAGLESGVDASLYADTLYDYAQMYAMRKCLEEGIDISPYISVEFDTLQKRRNF